MNIAKATRHYEAWLSTYMPLVSSDLKRKHTAMAGAPFPFLRSTFYRWAQTWHKVCKHLRSTPSVLAVGDLHYENFGTWRDTEGRLIWGINDFDEAAHMPYAQDLVRLATSAFLAIEASRLSVTNVDAAAAILSGYTDCIHSGGCAYVLAERHQWLRETAGGRLANPLPFWQKLEALPIVKPDRVPETAAVAIEHTLPQRDVKYVVHHRIAGLGSLGRPRYTALADWRGGKIAREAKALAPSAVTWANARAGPSEIFYEAVLDRSVRCRDPYVQLQGQWIVRRLAPDCARIELSSLPQEKPEARLLHAMGWETANIHLGSPAAVESIKEDLRQRGGAWLHSASEMMLRSTRTDWEAWKASVDTSC